MENNKKWSEFTQNEKKRAKINLTLIAIILASCVFVGIITCKDGNTKKTADKEIVYNSEWDGSVKQVEEYLKATLNDADSYSSVEWGTVVKNPDTKWYVVRHKYRAKNIFGGTVLKHQVFTLDSIGSILSVSDLE